MNWQPIETLEVESDESWLVWCDLVKMAIMLKGNHRMDYLVMAQCTHWAPIAPPGSADE